MSDGLKLADTYIHSVQSFPYTPLEEKFHKSPIRRKSEIFLKKISQKTGGGMKNGSHVFNCTLFASCNRTVYEAEEATINHRKKNRKCTSVCMFCLPEEGCDVVRKLGRDFGWDCVFRHVGHAFARLHQMVQVVVEDEAAMR